MLDYTFILFFLVLLIIFIPKIIHLKQKKRASTKEAIYNEIQNSPKPITVPQLGYKLGISNATIYKMVDELVSERRIGMTATQEIIQDRRIRIRHYHPIIGVSTHTST